MTLEASEVERTRLPKELKIPGARPGASIGAPSTRCAAYSLQIAVYGTLTTPLPLPTPSWSNQSLKPNFSPAFTVGARYIAGDANDIQLNWTHLNATANDSFFTSPTQMVGPPYLIGPESALYKTGYGSVKPAYDAVNLDLGIPSASNVPSNCVPSAVSKRPALARICRGCFKVRVARLPPQTPRPRCLPAPGPVSESRVSMALAISS